jgi:glutamate-1-semialdehyde 2,1-aminomutase
MADPPARARSAELLARASVSIPGGVSSPVRAFGRVGGEPYFVASGEGAYLVDVDGNRYVDWVQSWGATILGHAHPSVVAAVAAAAAAGTTFGAPTEREVQLAERICAAVAGCEMVRLVSSGTEAAMTAVRVARAATGRDRVVIFAGCYHGHSDALLAAGGSGVATLGLSGSAGVPSSAVAATLVAPYNQVPELGPEVACVVVEPVAANMGLVPPAEGFLRGLRARCDSAGALLVFDEVITGFRLSYGGAAESTGVQPDLWCFGKVIGGGLPLAAFGGRRDVMEQLAPSGPVYQAGTLSGNPVATARCWASSSPPKPSPTTKGRAVLRRPAGTRRSCTAFSSAAWPSPPGPTRCSSPASPTAMRTSTSPWKLSRPRRGPELAGTGPPRSAIFGSLPLNKTRFVNELRVVCTCCT